MKTLNTYINESLNATLFEGLLDLFKSGMKPEEFCETIAKTINKGIQIKYKDFEGKERIKTDPVRVSLMFEDLIITEFHRRTWKEYAKAIATSHSGKFDETEYKRFMEYLNRVWDNIKTHGGNFISQKAKDMVVGAIQVDIDYYDKDDKHNVYRYSHYLMFGEEESRKEFFDKLQSGKIDKEFISSVYWNLFVAIWKPEDKWANEDLKSFKKYCDPQIKERIKKIVGSGAEEKLKEWENKNSEK